MSRIQPARNSKLWPVIAEAENPKTAPARLQELATHASEWVRVPVGLNPSTPDDAILQMIEDPRHEKWFWADALRHRDQLEEALARSPRQIIRSSVAGTYRHSEGALRRSTQLLLAADESEEVRELIANTTNYEDIFDRLLHDPVEQVRAACAANPRIDRDRMEGLITDRSSVVRWRAVAMGERYPDEEQLLRLVGDRSSAVRWEVAISWRSTRRVMDELVNDADENLRQQARSWLEADALGHNDEQAREGKAIAARAIPGRFDSP